MNPEAIDRYEIKSMLGRGGMATVYYAYDPAFRRDVAIKILPREFMHDPLFRSRFEREAQTIAGLEHYAIVPVYDFGEEDGQPYLVMRYMAGGSLSDRIKSGPMLLESVVAIMQRIGAALDKAHLRNIIHRDLKPANILFDEDDYAYLSDFGIVKLTEEKTQLTAQGIVGTPAYMAPEMADEGGITPLIDVYALGVTLYQMLTSKLPYDADTPIGILMAHIGKPIPSVIEQRPELPDEVQYVINKALAKDPHQRYQTAGELANGLGAAFTALSGAAHPPLSDVYDDGGTAIISSSDRPQFPPVEEYTPPEPTTPPPPVSEPEPRQQTPPPARPEPAPRPPTAPPIRTAQPQPSPVPEKKKKERRRRKLPVGALVISQILLVVVIAVVGGYFLYQNGYLPLGGPGTSTTEPVVMTTVTRPPDTSAPTQPPTTAPEPTVLAGGSGVIAIISDQEGANEIYTMNIDGSNLELLTQDLHISWAPSWSPDGRRMAYASLRDEADPENCEACNSNIYAMNYPSRTNLVALTDDPGADEWPVWSPDGTRIAFMSDRTGTWEIFVMNPDGSNQIQLTNDEAHNRFPAWSPDGTKLLFHTNRDDPDPQNCTDCNYELYVMNADGSEPVRLTDSPSAEARGRWSPDGQYIVFNSTLEGNWDIYVMTSEGMNVTRLTDNEAVDCCAAWSPDGEWIIFNSNRDGNDELYLMRPDGSELTRLTNSEYNEYDPVWVP